MKTAMILAAGRGERLKPITNYMPKAMCSVKGMPLIEHHVRNLANAGFNRIVINHAYLGDQIKKHLGNGQRFDVEIIYSPEPPGGLETGGGIYNALPLLGKNPFVTINADIYTGFDLIDLEITPKSLAHLVLAHNLPHNPTGDFGLDNNNFLSNEVRTYTYLGIACYRPEAFESCTTGRYSVTPLLRRLTTQLLATGQVYPGKWTDIGSIDRLTEVNAT